MPSKSRMTDPWSERRHARAESGCTAIGIAAFRVPDVKMDGRSCVCA